MRTFLIQLGMGSKPHHVMGHHVPNLRGLPQQRQARLDQGLPQRCARAAGGLPSCIPQQARLIRQQAVRRRQPAPARGIGPRN